MPDDQAAQPVNREEDQQPTLEGLAKRVPALPVVLVPAAIVVGLILTLAALGLVLYRPDAPAYVANLVLCSGIGLVLTAFGTRAEGKWKNFVILGSGATVISLYLLLPQKEPPAPVSTNRIHSLKLADGDFSDEADVRIIDRGEELLGALDRARTVFRFVVEGQRFKDPSPTLSVKSTAASPKRSLRLKSGLLNHQLQKGGELDLRYDENAARVFIPLQDGNVQVVSEAASGTAAPPTPAGLSFVPLLSPTSAFAADPSAVPSLVDKLSTGNLRNSIDASNEILSVGTAAVSPLLEQLNTKADPATRAEIVSVLNSLLAERPESRSDLVDQLQEAHLRTVIELQTHPDKGIRSTATEFLISVNDPEATPLLVETATSSASGQLGRVNALVVLENVLKDLPDAEVSSLVRSIKARASDESDSVVRRRMQEFDEPMYYLVVASFVDSEKAKLRAAELKARGYADASAYALKKSPYFAATLLKERLRNIPQAQQQAVAKGDATTDAWVVRGASLGVKISTK